MSALKKYLKKREKSITVLLGKPRLAYTEVTFHKLRVEIKKLNAFFDLIKFCSKDFKRKKTFKPFKLLFRQAGKVREVQIEEEMLEKYFAVNILIEYRNNLRMLRLKRQIKYFSVANEKLAARLRKKCREVGKFLSRIDDRQINNYLGDRRHVIETLIGRKTLKASQIHKLRKHLKRLNYIQKLPGLDKTNETLVVKPGLLKLLGEWHDSQVFKRHLKLAVDTVGVNPEEKGQLKDVQAKVSSERKLLYNKINEAITRSAFFANESEG